MNERDLDGDPEAQLAARFAGGGIVPIRTGDLEEHITADVAWAAWQYHQWTGDAGFLAGRGRELITETARYWAARVRRDRHGAGHRYGVIGPDETRAGHEGQPPPNAGLSTPSPLGSVGGPWRGDASDQGGVVSGEVVGLILLIAWMSFGVLLALLMGRRGHGPAGWGILGMMLGPLAVPIALDAAHRHRRPAVKTLAAGEPIREGIAVLAGIDGSDEAILALRRAATVLGSRIGRLAVVTVLPYDAEDDPVVLESDQTQARLWMTAAREAAPNVAAEEYVVTGQPAKVLADLAESDNFDIIVVGARGRGMSPRLFGSVAGALAHSSPVPVLIGGRHEATPTPRLRAV